MGGFFMKDITRVKMFFVENESSNEKKILFDGTAKEFRANLSSSSDAEWNGFEKGDRFDMIFEDGENQVVKKVRVKSINKTHGLDDSLEKVEYTVSLFDEKKRDKEIKRSAGIRAEGGSRIYTDHVDIEGFDDGISVDTSSEAHVKNTSIKGIKNNMTDGDLEKIKGLLKDEFKDLESVIDDLKGQKDFNGIEKTLEKLSPFMGKLFLGYLKSQGYIE